MIDTSIPTPDELGLAIAGRGGRPRHVLVAALAPFAIRSSTGTAEERSALGQLAAAFMPTAAGSADERALGLARTIVAAFTPGQIAQPGDDVGTPEQVEAQTAARFVEVANRGGYFTGSAPNYSYSPNLTLLTAYGAYQLRHGGV